MPSTIRTLGFAAVLLGALTLSSASTLGAQDAPRSDTLPRPTLRVLRITTPPAIDGRLTDEVWSRAEATGNWVQLVPNSGEASSQRSEAKVLIDAHNVYVGIRLYDSAPDSIGMQLARRDVGDTYTDWVWVGFDSYGDRRTGFAFAVSPRGAQRDGYAFNDGEFDFQWDAVWQSGAQVDSLGWTAEMRIPLSQLRYTSGDATRDWGLQFLRIIARRGEEAFWSPRDPNSPEDVSRYGVLTGLGALEGSLPVEAVPYARSQVATVPDEPGNPFAETTSSEVAMGLDLRTRLPKSLNLAATFNPDFGQVEADPAVVNLSAFEIFFPERRPFFLENFDTFQFGSTTTFNANKSPNFFYTRRIGRAPQRRLSGEYVDAPTQTPILAAFKLSGTTPGGWAIGSLNATTGREYGRFVRADSTIGRGEVEPLTNSHVTRVRRLLRGGFTAIGGFGSWVERELSDSAVAALLPQRAVVTGLDFEHATSGRRWTLSGVASRSSVSGERAAITRLQRANYRSFQRPDADHFELDTTRTALAGGYFALSAAKTAGRLTGSVTAEQIDASFESNDIGFQTSSDLRSISTMTTYRQPTQTARFQSWEAGFGMTGSWNGGGDNLEARIAGSAEVQFRNFWSLRMEANTELGQYDDRLLRGGPVAARPVSRRLEFGLETDSRKSVIIGGGFEASANDAGRRTFSVGVGADWRPSSAVRVRLEPEFAANEIVDQFVTSRTDALATATFGRRYVFADVRQREARLNTRLDVTFTPYVSLQLFLQPFASAGRFQQYKEFLTPRRFEFAVYGEDAGSIVRAGGDVTVDPDGAGPAASFVFGEQDYTARELRGNAVLRWELRPGSTLFLVWQQTRDAFEPTADLNVSGQLGTLLGEPSRNVFLVKLAWWLGR